MARRLLIVLLVTILTCHDTSGARCRFANTSASQGSCIFPCRCTDGCNTTTGQCINGGRCQDGHPIGYRWEGLACQTGNIAYNKSASQSIDKWGGQFPAGRAVDGDTNPSMAAGHCAHPDTDWGRNAWWMVDLGDIYNFSRIVIYNRDSGNSGYNHIRLDVFILSVGDSPDRKSHTRCASHYGRVPPKGTVESQCLGINRYLSFRRAGGTQAYATGLCEIVVIGHRHIECQDCPSTSTCNDVIGCDICAPGKRQPNCTKDCEQGTYGTNCEEDCGHCKDMQLFDIKNGHCLSGCEAWYLSDVCTTYIYTPYFEVLKIPEVDGIGSSSVTVTWPKAKNISSGLETHYYYIVWLKAKGETYKNISKQPHTSNTDHFESQITGLQFNKHYSVKVEPYRQQNELREAGTSTGVTRFKTNCTAPDTPIIENVTTSTKIGATNGNIRVIWKTLKSGCDNITAVDLSYKLRGNQYSWKHKDANPVTDTQLTLYNLSYDEYEVKVITTNNENITSTSEVVAANFLTKLTCGQPPDVSHATIKKTGLGYMDTATYKCESGYHSGCQQHNLVCTKNAKWEGDTIVCTEIPSTTTTAKTTTRNGGQGKVDCNIIIIVVLAVTFVTIVGVIVAIFIVIRRRRSGENKGDVSSFVMSTFKRSTQSRKVVKTERGTREEAGGAVIENVEQGQTTPVEYINLQQTATRGVAVADLAPYVDDKKQQDGYKNEYEELPRGIQTDCKAAKKTENKPKNRFRDILPYDHTRVVLAEHKGQSDYINANHIKGYREKENTYIACQGPRDNTVEDMWRMVWQEGSNTILMLANLKENGMEKCSQYWPNKGETRFWGHFVTESVKEETFAEFVIREFQLKNEESKKMRRIYQLHFTSWPDRGTPQFAYPLLAFRRKLLSLDPLRRGPLVVHCSAGIGRTGTFIAIDILTRQAATEGKVDVFSCVNLLRKQRMNMVQTLDQYVYVYYALIEASQATVVSCSQLRQTFDELCREDKVAEQFERLNTLTPLSDDVGCAALESSNIEKNRHDDIIPDDQHRPFLVTPWKGTCKNYINAVYVHGYKERDAFIVTQSPMPNTVIDFWRMLADHKSRTVVMLEDCDVDDDTCPIYWPTDSTTRQQYGPFDVQLVATDVNETYDVTVRQFQLTKSGGTGDNVTIVKQFCLTGWGDTVPDSKIAFIELLCMVEKWQQQNGKGPITVHCSDGATRCGVLCAASFVIEHLKLEQEVDVFHAVQNIRSSRPQLVADVEQYEFLYELALEYMAQFNQYANFQ